jgi:hypothetical protein
VQRTPLEGRNACFPRGVQAETETALQILRKLFRMEFPYAKSRPGLWPLAPLLSAWARCEPGTVTTLAFIRGFEVAWAVSFRW